MQRARCNAREDAAPTEVSADHPRARDRERQGRGRQVVGHGQPRGRARGARPDASASSTPTSGASASRACSASKAASAAPTARSTRTTLDGRRPLDPSVRTGHAQGRVDGLPRRRRGHRAHVARPHPRPRRSSSSSPTCAGATSTTCSSTCRPAPATSRWASPGCCRRPRCSWSRRPALARAEGRGPRRRHGPPLVPEGRRRGREHERVRRARRRAVRDRSARAAAPRSRTRSARRSSREIPLEPAVSDGGDTGQPVALARPRQPAPARRSTRSPRASSTSCCRRSRWPAAPPGSSRSRRRTSPRDDASHDQRGTGHDRLPGDLAEVARRPCPRP